VSDPNPFFENWTTPFGLPPFDRISPEHFPPAFDRGMKEEAAESAAIAQSPEPPSFANTIAALERSGRLLARVGRVFHNLNASATNPALDRIARDYAPKLAAHQTRIALDPSLFERIAAMHAQRESLGLETDQMRLLERQYLRFVRAGSQLGPEQKTRMAEIQTRMASLHTLFGQNVLHDEDQWHLVLGEDELDGLPDFAREAAVAAARERGLDGYVITLARASVEPFLTFSARRDLRQAAYEAWAARGAHPGAHENMPLIAELLALRAEQARLLGYDSYAAYRLDDTMAKTPDAAGHLLAQVWAPAKRKVATEREELVAVAHEDGLNEPIALWDWRYYAEKVRTRKYAFDEAEVKPYFVLDNIVAAAFDCAGRLFGLAFVPRPDCRAYHEDVRVYEVRHRDGAAIGLFLHDNFARPGKRSGAWMSSYREQESLDAPVLPIVVNNNNFSKGDPTLLSFDDARTLFHEFGHGLHGLLSRVRYRAQAGTAVRRDFVEFPSQIMEHWVSAPEILRRYARHYRTGEPLPEDLLQRLLAARNFNQGFATVEYAACAMLDLELHRGAEPPADIAAAEFSDAGDMFQPELAARLKAIYSAGDTQDPMVLYRDFRGRDAQIDALLAQRGLNL
jgi:peptidyl-dipeptidase Dcp